MAQLPVNDQNLQFFDTMNRAVPCEGPRTVPLTLDFSLADTYYVTTQQMTNLQRLSMIQAVYLDNAGQATPLICISPTTGQRVIMAPGKQGYRNMLCPNPGQLNFVSESGAILKVQILNFPVIDSEWSTT